jgi:hypothetical protein
VVAAAALWLAPSASALPITMTIGQVAPPGSSGSCSACTDYQETTGAGSPSYTVPAALPGGSWTVISWSIRGGTSVDGRARLRVFRPTGTPNQFKLVAESAEEAVPAGSALSFATSIPGTARRRDRNQDRQRPR